jgi:hypothetical protein
MTNAIAIPQPALAAGQDKVVLSKGYLNYIGETRVYFLIDGLGWSLFYDVPDQALKQQLLTAAAAPKILETYVFYQGNKVTAVQVRTVGG